MTDDETVAHIEALAHAHYRWHHPPGPDYREADFCRDFAVQLVIASRRAGHQYPDMGLVWDQANQLWRQYQRAKETAWAAYEARLAEKEPGQ